MANWMGGSCPAMALQIAGGFCTVTVATLKGFLPTELNALKLELEKQLRNTRAEVPPQDDALAQQARNHKIGRLTAALQVVNNQIFAR
ncbi:MAG TPA: hypothetical protein VMT70_22185 [Vicinamibacteria bacterium]|nr:hypothetical protein [Vicinamibacteria bacterium]